MEKLIASIMIATCLYSFVAIAETVSQTRAVVYAAVTK